MWVNILSYHCSWYVDSYHNGHQVHHGCVDSMAALQPVLIPDRSHESVCLTTWVKSCQCQLPKQWILWLGTIILYCMVSLYSLPIYMMYINNTVNTKNSVCNQRDISSFYSFILGKVQTTLKSRMQLVGQNAAKCRLLSQCAASINDCQC